ncbi:hypothetical protein WDW89_17960 [Deltaproteobacteria bacterium TL4]
MGQPLPVIGILGMGFLGKALKERFLWNAQSWGTYRQESSGSTEENQTFGRVAFDWGDPDTWSNLPESEALLVLTIPPVFTDVAEETARLKDWGKWMKSHRPLHTRLIYISSTGVYPQQEGSWSEASNFEPDQNSGLLRLMTEQSLKMFFQLSVVRAGGIYGPDRNVLTRILQNKPLHRTRHPTHRVHVTDLARIVHLLLHHPAPPEIVNAVDNEPLSSTEVLNWLRTHPKLRFDIEKGSLPPESNTPDTLSRRYITNTLLQKQLNFQFQYPSFREGYAEILRLPTKAW